MANDGGFRVCRGVAAGGFAAARRLGVTGQVGFREFVEFEGKPPAVEVFDHGFRRPFLAQTIALQCQEPCAVVSGTFLHHVTGGFIKAKACRRDRQAGVGQFKLAGLG